MPKPKKLKTKADEVNYFDSLRKISISSFAVFATIGAVSTICLSKIAKNGIKIV